MTVGMSAVNLANAWLNTLRGASGADFTHPSTLFVQMHNGDPGSAGTSNVSTGAATRQSLSMAAASAGSQAISGTPSWTASGTDTVTHISVWSASTSGTFYYSAALTVSKSIGSGDTLQLSTLTFALTPIAA